jgi:hypothetical protein
MAAGVYRPFRRQAGIAVLGGRRVVGDAPLYHVASDALFPGEINSTRGDPNPKERKMNHITYVADRLDRNRAAALDRDLELQRRIRDRGITIAPARPAVHPLNALGVWVRSHRSAQRVRVSY